MAAVYGPTQTQARKEDVDKLAIEVCWRPPRTQTPADVDAERALRRTLEQIVLTAKYPRLGLRVVVQVISADGAVEACAMNATCHATEMFGTLVAATVPPKSRRRHSWRRARTVRGPDRGRGTRRRRGGDVRVLLPRG